MAKPREPMYIAAIACTQCFLTTEARGGGGNGLLRILEFDPEQKQDLRQDLFPYTRQYETDADSQFELSFNMLPQIAIRCGGFRNGIACYHVARSFWRYPL